MPTDTVYQNTFVGTPYWMVSLTRLEVGKAVTDRLYRALRLSSSRDTLTVPTYGV
jgi:hypothetical protein